MNAGTLAVIKAEGGFTPPGPADFDLPPIFAEVTKPMVMISLSVLLIFGLFYAMSRRAEVVPGRLQFAGEFVYSGVRNSVARESIGSEHFMKFVPYLFSLFLFVLVNNYFGMIPLVQLRHAHARVELLRGRGAAKCACACRYAFPHIIIFLGVRHIPCQVPKRFDIGTACVFAHLPCPAGHRSVSTEINRECDLVALREPRQRELLRFIGLPDTGLVIPGQMSSRLNKIDL